jgi:N6-adenosine-specific RNA methylase IME4
MAEGEATGRRPRRAAAKNSAMGGGSFQPSAMHYVGYVEEDETPEQIMAKFEQLEKIQREVAEAKRAALEEDGGEGSGDRDTAVNPDDADLEDFDQALLEKVFARTSKFSLKRALADDLYGDDEDAFFDEDEEDVDVENIFGGWGKKKRKLRGAPREPKASRPSRPQKSHMITAYNSDNQMLMRKKKITDPRVPDVLKLPNHPIPVSWGRVVKPFIPEAEVEREKQALPDCVQKSLPILETDLTALGTDFLAVHCNPPWKVPKNPDAGSVTVDQIAAVPFQKLAPYGFVFMWVEKENLSAVCDVMLKKAFVYVENLTWVQQRPNNTIANSAAEYVRRSHRTMLMFRRDVRQFPEAKDVELRHQRNADCTLNVTCTTATGRRAVPEHVYKAMETLLPEAYKETGRRGRLLELWSEPGSAGRRSGWTVVSDAPRTPKTARGKGGNF